MKNSIGILLMFFTLTVFCQQPFDESAVSKGLIKVVNDIAKTNTLMSSAVGYAGVRTEQYDNFEKLEQKATKEELIALTDHPNGVVRCYAFWALSHKSDIDLYAIVVKHLNDITDVKTQFGCIGSDKMVGDFFIQLVTPDLIDADANKLDSVQMAKLDSMLIYSPFSLRSRASALKRTERSESVYSQIRKLVVDQNDKDALVALAAYQKEQDVKLIMNNKDKDLDGDRSYTYTYMAISKFPHPDFLPLLEKNLNNTFDKTHFSSEWRYLYMAIAAYQNQKAVELLQMPFTRVQEQGIKKYHIDFVFAALKIYKVPIYENLMWKLWEEENRINADVFEYLLSSDKERVLGLCKESLLTINETYSVNLSSNYYEPKGSGNLMNKILDLVIKEDKAYALDMIGKNIKTANVHVFPTFADKAAELKDTLFIEPLFERLETEWNAHIYLKIAEALIAYNNTEINQRIVATRKKNSHLNEDWGGNSLDQLLKKHRID